PIIYRDVFTDTFVWRLTLLGVTALGFLATYLLLDHEIHALKNVVLPLLIILPLYLVLTSLNLWWAAQATAKLGQSAAPVVAHSELRLRMTRVLKVCIGLAFGVLAALWYIHSVSQ
ncbi:MAG TPA: hypothetical protein VGQ96_06665, partial [Candidatus Eremiobacteraceae bacterium]|nr:hypothetical protein [Candidatus Eremiobacteraceae bacterium]